MGRKPGYRHSEATKARIAASVKRSVAVVGSPVVVQTSVPATIPAAAVVSGDTLDALANGPLDRVIALMLWKNRHNDPEMAMQLTERDLNGFSACVQYLGVVPEVRIVRPQGFPGHEGIAATRTRSAIPPQPPTPPKPYVVVVLVEKGTENAIKPVENNEADWQAAEEAKNFNHARDNALRLAGELQQTAATGNFSSSIMQEAAQALAALAR